MFDNFKPVKKIVTSYIPPHEKKYREFNITKNDLFMGYDTNHKPVILDKDIVRQHFLIMGDDPSHAFHSLIKHNLSNYASGLILKNMSSTEMDYIIHLASSYNKMDSIKFISFKSQPLFNKILPISLNMLANAYPEIDLALQLNIFSPYIIDVTNISYENILTSLNERIESLQITRALHINDYEKWGHFKKYNIENKEYQDMSVISEIITFFMKLASIFEALRKLDIILVPDSEETALNWMVFFKTNLIICPNLKIEENLIMMSIYKYTIGFLITSAFKNIKDPESNAELNAIPPNNIQDNFMMFYIEFNNEIVEYLMHNMPDFIILLTQARGLGVYNIYYLKSLPSESHKFISSIIANTNTKIIARSIDSLRSLYEGHYAERNLNFQNICKLIILDKQIDLIPEMEYIGFKPVNRYVNI